MVEKQADKHYNYFVDLCVNTKSLFDNLTPADILWMSEMPYCLFNDFFTKQIEDNKRTRELIKNNKNAIKTTPTRKGPPRRR